MKIDIVIGANYGDEGKGLVTEFRCRNNINPIVVLSNGGCQRGHTVNNPETGIRHVFHHFGSGTMLGVPSIYAKTFLLNPIKFVEEKAELESCGISPVAYRAPGCILQLPSDMFINQEIEKARRASNKHHGSCGWGIWETQVRNKEYKSLTFEDFASMDYDAKRRHLIEAADWQAVTRIRGVYDKLIDWKTFDLIESDAFINHFIQDVESMEKSVKLLESDNLLDNNYDTGVGSFVVENAQGLLLDMNYAPEDENGRTDIHTTPSKCGLEGSLEALGEDIDLDDVSTFYVSRTYLTRHGEGPFPEEVPNMKLDPKEDLTNVYNDHQGNIRCGHFTYDSLHKLMQRCHNDGHNTSWNVVFTHCNTFGTQNFPRGENLYWSFDEDSRHILKDGNE